MTTDYCTTDDVKDSGLKVTNSASDTRIARNITSASRMIDGFCNRRFYLDSTTSSRVYWPNPNRLTCIADLDDIGDTTGLTVKADAGDDGTYETTYTNYQLYPLNGLANGLPWAYDGLELVSGQTFPSGTYKPPIQVTAKWGWPAVPDAVKQAAIVQTIRLFAGEGAPFGVLEVADVTVARLPQVHPEVAALLAPYRRYPVLVA